MVQFTPVPVMAQKLERGKHPTGTWEKTWYFHKVFGITTKPQDSNHTRRSVHSSLHHVQRTAEDFI